MKKYFFFMPVLIAVAFSACKKEEQPLITISPAELVQAYSNVKEANATYIGKTLQLTGQIERMGLDVADIPYVQFAGDQLGGIQCFFKREDHVDLAQFKVGQTVTIQGRCIGRIIHIALDQCVLLSSK